MFLKSPFGEVTKYVCMYVNSFHSKGIVVTFSRFFDNLCLKIWRGRQNCPRNKNSSRG